MICAELAPLDRAGKNCLSVNKAISHDSNNSFFLILIINLATSYGVNWIILVQNENHSTSQHCGKKNLIR